MDGRARRGRGGCSRLGRPAAAVDSESGDEGGTEGVDDEVVEVHVKHAHGWVGAGRAVAGHLEGGRQVPLPLIEHGHALLYEGLGGGARVCGGDLVHVADDEVGDASQLDVCFEAGGGRHRSAVRRLEYRVLHGWVVALTVRLLEEPFG